MIQWKCFRCDRFKVRREFAEGVVNGRAVRSSRCKGCRPRPGDRWIDIPEGES